MAPTSDLPPGDVLTGKRVLTVEDEGITQMQLNKILVSAGMERVGIATSGPQGVEVAMEHRPDIILMDINMPGEYNGLEAARRILAEYRTCIVMLTAYAEYAEQAASIGAHGYVVKPVDRVSLLHEIKSAFATFQSAEFGIRPA